MPESPATEADFELGRTALLEITTEKTIGEPVGSVDEGDGVVSVYFDTTMAGYKGWRWTVSIAHIDGGDPSVLEAELTPGETALLSPAWVPWADRLAEYKASQSEQDSEDSDAGDDGDDDDDFDDEDVNDDDDDFDGVDIDSLEDDSSDERDDAETVDAERESAPAVSVDQPDDAEDKADDAGPEKPRRSRSKKKDDD